jgi:hypothetical protein
MAYAGGQDDRLGPRIHCLSGHRFDPAQQREDPYTTCHELVSVVVSGRHPELRPGLVAGEHSPIMARVSATTVSSGTE